MKNTLLQKVLSASAVAALAVTLVVGGIAAADKPKVVVETTEIRELDAVAMPSFAPVVRKVAPSVVQVETVTEARTTSLRGGPDMENPLFRWFFGEDPRTQPRTPRGPRQFQMPQQRGAGSGVVVTEDGYLLTNHHVVDGADQVKVRFQDGREFTAKVVGTDPQTDVAVLKIEAKGLPAVTLADSDALEVGDIVLALGNPFGIGQTVTSGIVSAKGRATLGLDYEDFIQTDAAINPGNSGGALVDARGRLVGINTAILSRSGGNQGIGFAIPVNLARGIMDGLVQDGRVSRGFIGVFIQDVTPALARQFKLGEAKGALVSQVQPGGPADKAGLKSGDVVVKFGDKPVQDSRQLRLAVASQKPGTAAPLEYVRDGKTRSAKLTLQELNNRSLEREMLGAVPTPEEETLRGVVVGDLDAQARREFEIPAEVNGVVVREVDPSSAAYEAQLRPGQVILEINRRPVKSADQAVELTRKAEDKTTLLRVWHNGGIRFIVVDENPKN